MVKVILIERNGAWYPADDHGREVLARAYKRGGAVRAQVTVPRNARFLRLFWGALTVLHEAADQDTFPTPTALLDAIKMGLGLVDEFRDHRGAVRLRPGSIAFDRMDETAFTRFAEQVFQLASERMLPHAPADIRERFYKVLEGRDR